MKTLTRLLSMIETIWAKFAAYTRWANTDLAVGTLNNHARALEGIRRRDAIMARICTVDVWVRSRRPSGK